MDTRAPLGTGLTAPAEPALLLPHPPQLGNHAQTQGSFSDNLFLAHGLPAPLCRAAPLERGEETEVHCREPGLRAAGKRPGPTPSTPQRAHTARGTALL